MAKAQKQLPQRIATVDQAVAAMGGDDRVAKWLRIHPSELGGAGGTVARASRAPLPLSRILSKVARPRGRIC